MIIFTNESRNFLPVRKAWETLERRVHEKANCQIFSE